MDRSSFTGRFDFIAAVTFAAALLAGGCQPRGTDLAGLYRLPPPPSARVSYETVHSYVLGPQCVACHVDFSSEAGLRKYLVPGDPESSTLYRSIANGSMPPGGPPLSAGAVHLVEAYISQAQAAPAPTPKADYVAVRSRILEPRCLTCHSDMATEDGFALYLEPGDPEGSAVVQSIENGRMPPGGGQIPAADLATLRTYIAGLSAE
jgi:mono/diheme cytochrome c family protein